jgi:hypothetical protein
MSRAMRKERPIFVVGEHDHHPKTEFELAMSATVTNPLSAADIIQPMMTNLEKLLKAKFPEGGGLHALLLVSPREIEIRLGLPGYDTNRFFGDTFARAFDSAVEWVTHDEVAECNLTLGLTEDGRFRFRGDIDWQSLPNYWRPLPNYLFQETEARGAA